MNNTHDSLPALGESLITSEPGRLTSKHPRMSDQFVIHHGQGELHRVGLRRGAFILVQAL